MKKILTIAPLQHVEAGNLIYQSINNEKLQYNVPTCFPVLPLIHGYMTTGDSAEVFVLTTENHQIASENYKIIECEIKKLCAELGVYHPKRNSVCRTAVSGAGKLSSQCGTL